VARSIRTTKHRSKERNFYEKAERSFPMHKLTIKANKINKVPLSATTKALKERLIKIGDDIQHEACSVTLAKLRSNKKILKAQVCKSTNSEIRSYDNKKLEKSSNKSSTAWKLIKASSGIVPEHQSISALNFAGN
jgi:exonuclease I